MQNLEKLQATLPMLKNYDYKTDTEKEVKPYSFIREGLLFLSMENGDGAGCYYGKYKATPDGQDFYQDGVPYITDSLEVWAKENNGYWEWQDGGTIVFCAN